MENRRERGWLRTEMPQTAAFIDAIRSTFCETPGQSAELDEAIKRGMSGEPGWFYAMEGGRQIGTSDDVERR